MCLSQSSKVVDCPEYTESFSSANFVEHQAFAVHGAESCCSFLVVEWSKSSGEVIVILNRRRCVDP